MNKIIHFCGGLPRSGSTVLMNILQQNPTIFTTGTCALPELLGHTLIKSRYRESYQAMDQYQADSALHGFATQGAQGWFAGLTHKPIVISKHRTWSNYWHLFPEAKYIAMIRDLRDIAESFDRVNHKLKAGHTFSDSHTLLPAMTESERIQYYFRELNPVSGALNTELNRVVEAHRRGKPVLFIRYEDFVQNPRATLASLYNFLELPHHEHDLMNIKQSEVYEHDHAYFRERTSHTVKPYFQMGNAPQRQISAPGQQQIIDMNIGYYELFYPEVLK